MKIKKIGPALVAGLLVAGCAQFIGMNLSAEDRLTLACEHYASALARAATYEFNVGYDNATVEEIDRRVERVGSHCDEDGPEIPVGLAADEVAAAADYINSTLPFEFLGKLKGE